MIFCFSFGRSGGRGFSLIEAAIVLGVVGLVIGGIWVASSVLMERHRVLKAAEGVLQIIERTQRAYKGMPLDATGVTLINPFKYNPVGAGIDMKLLPDDWIQSGQPVHPLGTPDNLAADLRSVMLTYSASGLDLTLAGGISQSECYQLLKATLPRCNCSVGLLYTGSQVSSAWDDSTLVSLCGSADFTAMSFRVPY